jgi:hypothetical protein
LNALHVRRWGCPPPPPPPPSSSSPPLTRKAISENFSTSQLAFYDVIIPRPFVFLSSRLFFVFFFFFFF